MPNLFVIFYIFLGDKKSFQKLPWPVFIIDSFSFAQLRIRIEEKGCAKAIAGVSSSGRFRNFLSVDSKCIYV